jgi:C4-dicarboxylate transporter/malic acid transport protein
MNSSEAASSLRSFGRRALESAGPGWFTIVMGTGILAICATISPVEIPFARAFGAALWSIDVVLFAGFALLWMLAAIRDPRAMRASLTAPRAIHLLGAPPMACFTIAVGSLDIGTGLFPAAPCVAVAQVLFIAGVAGSILSAFLVPYLMITRYELTQETTAGNWLLSIVPPIVASVPAALLSPTWPAEMRGDVLGVAYGLLGIGLALAAITIVLFYGRLVYHKVPEGALVTTMWIVVGPLGQSIAGMIALGRAAVTVWPSLGQQLALAGTAYGVLVWGFAMYWLAMAIVVTIRAARKHLPFNLGWWAFTFPVGVLTAGTDALYAQTRAHIFAGASVLLLALLASMWLLVASKTLRNALYALPDLQRGSGGGLALTDPTLDRIRLARNTGA